MQLYFYILASVTRSKIHMTEQLISLEENVVSTCDTTVVLSSFKESTTLKFEKVDISKMS